MKNRTAPWLAIVAALGLAGCESSSTPVAPTTGPAPVEGGTTFIAQAAEGPGIVIQRCELDIGMSLWSGEIRLYGSRGFSLTASVDQIGGLVRARECLASTCTPGDEDGIPLYASWLGGGLRGATVTLDGKTYTNVGSAAAITTAAVYFGGSDPQLSETVLEPPLTKRGTDQIKAPFTVSGHFGYPEGRVDFVGGGVVTLWLAHTSGSPGWAVQRLLYKCKHQSDWDTQ